MDTACKMTLTARMHRNPHDNLVFTFCPEEDGEEDSVSIDKTKNCVLCTKQYSSYYAMARDTTRILGSLSLKRYDEPRIRDLITQQDWQFAYITTEIQKQLLERHCDYRTYLFPGTRDIVVQSNDLNVICTVGWDKHTGRDIDYEEITPKLTAELFVINNRNALMQLMDIGPYPIKLGNYPLAIGDFRVFSALEHAYDLVWVSRRANLYDPTTWFQLKHWLYATRLDLLESLQSGKKESAHFKYNTTFADFHQKFPFEMHLNLSWIRPTMIRKEMMREFR